MRTRLAIACLLPLAACGKGGEEGDAPPPLRPVLSVVVKPVGRGEARFAGTIEPRYRTDRGFQVLGRIQSYDVDVGDIVRRGQELARLDPTSFILDVRSKEGDLARVRSQAVNAAGEQGRTRQLVEQKVSTQAELDSDVQAAAAAAASVQQAEAELAKAREQFGYATLLSDEDGVVTTKDADVGQTVSAGQKVMTIARTDVREAVVDLPEEDVAPIKGDAAFAVTLQADTTVTATGKVREVAPQADASTRTRRVRITLDHPPDAFRLGTTVTVTQTSGTAGNGDMEIPRSAVLQKDGAARVWLVDTRAKTVRTVPVEIAPGEGNLARLTGGLSAGQRIVVAGIHSLAEGQTVRLDEGEAE